MPQEQFRDKLSTLNDSGERQWIYAKKPKGRFYTYRQIAGYSLILLLLIGPFIRIGGEPLLLFNFLERKFVILGQVFQPQDFHLLVLAMLAFILFIVLFTVIYGRVWCGWACPQTLFMELVFRRIEFLLEGDGPRQKQRAGQPLSVDLIIKKVIKHLLFYAISFIISLYLISYLIGTERIFEIIRTGHFKGYLAFFIFSFVFYGIFAWLREQACTLICPYGRLQGVLLDSGSLVVAYDYKRGEPRSVYRKNENRKTLGMGDCVDCSNCIRVCPTGIDIRNGTQLECINCTACIDACNSVMKKFSMPGGLVRFASEKGIEEGKKFSFSPRLIFYSVVLLAILILFSSLLFLRSEVEITVERTKGMLYQKVDENNISNLYNIKITNKTKKEHEITLHLISPSGEIKQIGGPAHLSANDVSEGVFLVILPRENISAKNIHIKIDVYTGDVKLKEVTVPFLGP